MVAADSDRFSWSANTWRFARLDLSAVAGPETWMNADPSVAPP